MNETSKTTADALKAARAATEASKQLTAAEGAMRAEHAGMLKQRKEIMLGNAAETEVTANIERLVSEHAAKFADSHGVRFVRELGGHSRPRTGPKEFDDVSPRLPSIGSDLAGHISFQDLCGLAPSLVKARLVEIVHASGAKFGLPKAQREAKLAELDRQIASMESSHTKLVEDASAVAIALPLLDAVAKRQAAEAEARARAERVAADRARGVFTADGASLGGTH